MSISQDQVVSIHYTLRDDAGEVIDRSAEGEPLSYLHGRGNLIPGLERELTGRKPGDRLHRGSAPDYRASSARIGRTSVSTAMNLIELLLRLGFDKHRDHFGMLFTQQPFHLGDALLDVGYG